MNKYFSLLLIPLSIMFFVHSVKAETINLSDIQSEKETLQVQIQAKEKKIDSLIDPEDEKEKEEAINEKIQIYMEFCKLAAKEEAFKKAMGIDDTRNSIISTNSEFSSFVPPDLLNGELVPKEYMKYYVAAGEKYHVDWTVLAAIHSIETSFSTDSKMISSVGAVGHMQFMPSTFEAYGVDGDGNGQRSPWSLPDAIFSAANYLDANDFKNSHRKAIWHYNHADWYVNKVLATAAIFSDRS